jgi:hypothetical protein
MYESMNSQSDEMKIGQVEQAVFTDHSGLTSDNVWTLNIWPCCQNKPVEDYPLRLCVQATGWVELNNLRPRVSAMI